MVFNSGLRLYFVDIVTFLSKQGPPVHSKWEKPASEQIFYFTFLNFLFSKQCGPATIWFKHLDE